MKDFLRLDVVIQNVAKKLKGKYKISRLIKSISFAWFVFTLIATVWSLIPKSEEIPEVDADAFLKAQLDQAAKAANEEVPELSEEVKA